ncbi:pimeloyl-[acyl-carrier protein] methyl ester esterase [Nitrosospira briensis]|uniref:Pimeloyl-[acyl-carrier protein] methyl ester esterase n=1 Tax=Nitrosospira briensis TaxID=35799 RepID=A0A1I4XTF1_9PROT|nr:alpha/beta fold hydrolase [Nitrosospira briensis]SFN29155.1 pimeloyl-[acyl-carrier protein] methyl ester esterase [Nitrosospira briensis]
MSLHIESVGAGPDLVLLHGWAMHSGIWREVRSGLAQHFRLHLVDLPGHGFSPGFNTADISGSHAGMLERTVEMIADILPANCIACGWSLGGQVAIELALRDAARIAKVALISTTPSFVKRKDGGNDSHDSPGQAGWAWGMDATALQLFTRNLRRDCRTTLQRFLTLQVSGGSDTASELTWLRDSLFERGDPDEASLAAGLQILLSADLRKKIKNISQPVLLFHGENDVITHPDAARWMNRQLQNSKLIMLRNCGHVPFLSYPGQFIDGMVRFSRTGTR